MVDELFKIVAELDPALELKYNKFYIGVARHGQPNNFVDFRPQKNALVFEVGLKQSDEVQAKIDESCVDTQAYSRWGCYRLRLKKQDLQKHTTFLRDLIKLAFDSSGLATGS